MNLISRKQARADGRKHYWTGKPCPVGHISKRLVSTRACTACSHLDDIKRYHRDREREKARGLKRARLQLPEPTRPCPSVCELCSHPPGKRALSLDHDHRTGEFRGWLCSSCNLVLGRFGDNVAGLQRAINYLRPVCRDAQARKECPVARGVLDYFPDSLLEVAHVSFVGNQQHNPGEELHWAKEKSTDEADCILRHLIDRGKLDSDGLRHSAKVAWRALALLQREIEDERARQIADSQGNYLGGGIPSLRIGGCAAGLSPQHPNPPPQTSGPRGLGMVGQDRPGEQDPSRHHRVEGDDGALRCADRLRADVGGKGYRHQPKVEGGADRFQSTTPNPSNDPRPDSGPNTGPWDNL